MIKRVLRRLLNLVGLFDKIREIKYKELEKFLNIKDGFVYNIQQVKFENGKLTATGDDPQIFIGFRHKTPSIKIEYNIEHQGDQIEVFCSENGVYTTEENKRIVGKCDGRSNSKLIPLKQPYKYFRLDLTKSGGEINIKILSIAPDNFVGNEFELKMKEINTVRENGYVIVTHIMDGTGAPLLAYHISKKLKECGKDVVLISLMGGILEEKYQEQEIPVFNFGQSTLNEVVNKEELDKIVSGLYAKGYRNLLINTTVSGIVAPYFKKCDYKIISLIHEMKNSIVRYDMKDGGRNAAFYSDCLVFPDKIVEKEFKSVFNVSGDKLKILPQGLYKKYKKITPNKAKVCKKYHIPDDAKIIVGSGMASFRKGIDLFFNAATTLIKSEKANGPKYHFIWTGECLEEDFENWFSYQLEKSGIKKRIHIASFIGDPKEYQNIIECADAFWLTSREDPFPSVMIEALSYNTPVLAFRGCGGADTLLNDGRGILVENFDTNVFADETAKLINNPQRVKKMIEAAQDYINKNLNFDKYVEKLTGLFEEKMLEKYADVSVVIPNYNYEKYLPMRIMSIINQTIKPKEIILLDDNSTDKSVEVSKPLLDFALKEYGISYRIIKNKENHGCFRQWVKGFNEAKHNYVWMAEADDYAKPNFIETVLPSFNDEDVVLSYSKSFVIDSFSVVADYDYNSYLEDLDKHKWEKDFVCDGKKFVIDFLSSKNVIPNASSTIIRKSATKEIDKYLNEYQAIGDWFAYIFLIAKGKVCYHADTLNGHRRHGKSIIANQEKSKLFIKEMIMIKKYLLDHFDFDDKKLNRLMLSTFNENFDINLVNNDNVLLTMYQELIRCYQEKKKRENLLVIVPDFEAGGGQTVGIRFANSFSKYYNVFILNAREWLVTDYMKDMISDDVEILQYDNDLAKLKFFNSTFAFKAVLSLIWWSDKLSYLAFKDMNTKRIISMHGCYENILDNPEIDSFFGEKVEDLLTSAAHVVYTAEKNRRIFEEKNIELGEKISKIDNGFSLGDFPKKTRGEIGISKDDFVFGLVARGIPEKGYEQAIEGIKYINNKLKNKTCHLVLVGSGDYISELKKENPEPFIHFIDHTTEPLEWIGWEEIIDAGMLPTYFNSESLPTALVEMLFLEKPIIATDIGEIKSMIVSKEKAAGIVIPLKNGKPDQEKLNRAMLDMVTNGELYKQYKDNTKDMAKRFDMDKCIDQYRALIED